MSSFCVNNRLIAHVIFLFITFILLLTCIYGSYKYYKFSKENASSRPPKLLSVIGPIHLIISILALSSALIYYIFEASTCYDIDVVRVARERPDAYISFMIYMIFYCTQVYGLWFILFLRLRQVFQSSVYQISCCTNNILRAVLIIMPLLVIAILSGQLNQQITILLTSLCMIISACYCIFITSIFVYKLFKVYKNFNSTPDANTSMDDELLVTITKNTLLAIISIISTILNGVVVVIAYSNLNNVPLWYFKDFCWILEMYTNFGCILLTYQYFDEYYLRFCGCIDARCRTCCYLLAGTGNIDQGVQKKTHPHLEIASVTSMSGSSVNSMMSVTIV